MYFHWKWLFTAALFFFPTDSSSRMNFSEKREMSFSIFLQFILHLSKRSYFVSQNLMVPLLCKRLKKTFIWCFMIPTTQENAVQMFFPLFIGQLQRLLFFLSSRDQSLKNKIFFTWSLSKGNKRNILGKTVCLFVNLKAQKRKFSLHRILFNLKHLNQFYHVVSL